MVAVERSGADAVDVIVVWTVAIAMVASAVNNS